MVWLSNSISGLRTRKYLLFSDISSTKLFALPYPIFLPEK